MFYTYLTLILAILVFLGTILLVRFLCPKYSHLIIERIIPFVLIAIVIVRFMSYKDVQFNKYVYEYYSHFGGPMNPFLNSVGNFCIWFETTALLLVLLRPWTNFKTAKFYVKYIALPILVISAIALNPMLKMMQGHDQWSVLSVLLPIEIGGLLSLSLYYLAKDYKIHISSLR